MGEIVVNPGAVIKNKNDIATSTNDITTSINNITTSINNIVVIPQKIVTDNLSIATRTFSIPSSSRFLIFGISGITSNIFACMLYTTSAGAIGRVNIFAGSNVTLDSSTPNRLTVTFQSGSSCPVLVFSTTKNSLDGFKQL